MFSVLFEVNPAEDQYDEYLANAKMLRPELEHIDGFVDNVRYRSLQRAGWILSLSGWRDEKSVIRWRTTQNHHNIQQLGRDHILSDYHLRVGEVIADNRLPEGMSLRQQRTDETEVGEGTMATLVTAIRPPGHPSNVTACSQFLGLDIYAGPRMVGWDVYEALLDPGDLILVLVWRDSSALDDFDESQLPETHRIRHVRIIRDYGMFDRREAPQYYPERRQFA